MNIFFDENNKISRKNNYKHEVAHFTKNLTH